MFHVKRRSPDMDLRLIDSCRAVVDSAYASFTRPHEIPVLALVHDLVGTVLSHVSQGDEARLRSVLRNWRDTVGRTMEAALQGGRYGDFLAKLNALWAQAAGPDLRLIG